MFENKILRHASDLKVKKRGNKLVKVKNLVAAD